MTYAARDVRDAITRVMHEKGQKKMNGFVPCMAAFLHPLRPLHPLSCVFSFIFKTIEETRKRE